MRPHTDRNKFLAGLALGIQCALILAVQSAAAQEISDAELKLVRAAENARIQSINKVIGSVVAIYGENRQGGGSGVIIDPSGIALTNHHVIIGAGVSGWGGLNDGHLYHWKLIGTDPGGDVALIQMEPRTLNTGSAKTQTVATDSNSTWQFPYTPLGDSDTVRVGDWALAMGNPFILAEDQRPTVTLGIVSGVKRYQPGAGKNQLVYGNCIQVDSSINPGNSGGPLFNMNGQVIGINGRGSFQDRGRVNVGLGYAISSNQIKNFIPDLMATKVVEHGTLDANFTDRNGKVLCNNLYNDSPLYTLGVRPGDELLEFEGIKINSANHFTNLICTLPEDWPAQLVLKNKAGESREIHMRLFGLPYSVPKNRPMQKDKKPTPAEKQQQQQMQQLIRFLSTPPGSIRNKKVNRQYAEHVLEKFNKHNREFVAADDQKPGAVLHLSWNANDVDGQKVGSLNCWISGETHEFLVQQTIGDSDFRYLHKNETFYAIENDTLEEMPNDEAMRTPPIVMALGILAANSTNAPFAAFGSTELHGSGKAQHRNAFRMRLPIKNDEHFYYWLSMYDAKGNDHIELLKAAATMDCIDDLGGVTFYEWRKNGGHTYPARCGIVRRLNELTLLEFDSVQTQALVYGSGGIADAEAFKPKTTHE